jgi:tellurite methyltransferase
MTGWQRLWKDPEVVKLWQQFPPLPPVVAMAERLAHGGQRAVLDIGCGVGRHVLYLAARGFAVTGLDNSRDALRICRGSLERAGLTAALVEGEMTAMAFRPDSFDGVVASHAIHHVDGPTLRRIIGAITELLTTGGLLAWATPSTRNYRCGRGRELDPGTWVDDAHEEGPVPHHYCSETEVRQLLGAYDLEAVEEHEYIDEGGARCYWHVLARKRGRWCVP